MKIFHYLLLLITLVCHEVRATTNSLEDANRQKLLSLFAGEWVARGLYVATKLEIADQLEQGARSIEELATASQVNPQSLYRLLQMLTSFGVFEEISPKVFANTGTSQLLAECIPSSLHALSLFYGEDIHQAWQEILPSLQTGTPAFELSFQEPVFSYFKNNPDRALLFQKAMKEKSQAVIRSALSNYDFDQFTCLCDVGGGYGQFVQALLQKHSNLSAAVFELPEVIEHIELQNTRCELVAGDFFRSIPAGYDAYLLKSVIHDWDDEKAQQILKNCYAAMRSDSRLLLVEAILQAEDHASYAHCMDFLMLAVTGGKERNLTAIIQLLEKSGFVIEHIYPTATEFSIIEARKITHGY